MDKIIKQTPKNAFKCTFFPRSITIQKYKEIFQNSKNISFITLQARVKSEWDKYLWKIETSVLKIEINDWDEKEPWP